MDMLIVVGVPSLIWLSSVAYVIYEYVIKPKKRFFEGLADFYREMDDDEYYWW